jgi:cephalosporin hydroxylase
MEDLMPKLRWLMAHDDVAQQIGKAGQELAQSMTYDVEVQRVMPAIAAAMKTGSGQTGSSVAADLMHRIHGENVFSGFTPEASEDLQGWNSHPPLFADIFGQHRPRIIFDVGVWKGASTLTFARLLRDNGIDGAVVGIDTFLGSPEHNRIGTPGFALIARRNGRPMLYEQFLANVIAHDHASRVVPLPQTSANAAALLAHLGVMADLIHIDAAHDYASVMADARAYWRLLAPGGFLIGDDYHETWPGVVKAAKDFSTEVGCELTVEFPKWIVRKPA